jgi:hypothetical protein
MGRQGTHSGPRARIPGGTGDEANCGSVSTCVRVHAEDRAISRSDTMSLRCAVHSRFGCDRHSPISIDNQIPKCREYAGRQGWACSRSTFTLSTPSAAQVLSILRSGATRRKDKPAFVGRAPGLYCLHPKAFLSFRTSASSQSCYAWLNRSPLVVDHIYGPIAITQPRGK